MRGKQNIPLFFAVRTCLRGKRNFFALLCGIVLSIALLVVSINTNQVSLLRQEESVLRTEGNWHVAYQLDDPAAQAKLDALPGVEKTARCFFVPSVRAQAYAEPFQVLGLERQKLPGFLPLSRGAYPEREGEAIVPEWFLQKYDLELSGELAVDGAPLRIVGAFDADYALTNYNLPVFVALEENPSLEKLSVPGLPWGYVSAKDDAKAPVPSVLITLTPGTNLRDFCFRIEQAVPGVSRFSAPDMFEIVSAKGESVHTAPLFHSALITVQNVPGSGSLLENGAMAAVNRLNTVYLGVVLGIGVLLIITFFNLRKRETVRQFGILRAMGITPAQLVSMQALQISLLYLVSLPVGLGLGFLVSCLLAGPDSLRFPPVLGLGLLADAASMLLPGLLLAAQAAAQNPTASIRQGEEQTVLFRAEIRHSRLVKCRRFPAFAFFYAMRNLLTHKLRLFSTLAAVALLFTLVTVTVTQMNLMSSRNFAGKPYPSDLAVVANSAAQAPSQDFLDQVRSVPGIAEQMAPEVYQQDVYLQDSPSTTPPPRKPSVLTKIPREAVTSLFEQVLLLANYESFVNNGEPEIWANSGLLGCHEEELDYLETRLTQGSVDPLRRGEAAVLVPQYFTRYPGVTMTTLRVGDTLSLGVAQGEDPSHPSIPSTTAFTVAGFVDQCPFETKNGTSNQFAVMMPARQLQELVETSVRKIELQVEPGRFEEVLFSLQKLVEGREGYSVKDMRADPFQLSMEQKAAEEQAKGILVAIGSAFLILLIGLCNLLFVQMIMRRGELRLLYVTGISTKQLCAPLLLETAVFSVTGTLLGAALSLYITKTISSDVALKNLLLVPWGLWIAIGCVLVGVCLLCTAVAATGLGRSLRKGPPQEE